ncbi:hypothetical protein M434DRAFT_38033 [Hypoxylon sp. CO27-5]|nr:hypothetical protein M434DRAFT_38033 [Hypoxylon sp. CO27-5]
MSASSRVGTLALSGSLMGLSIIAVGLRFLARRRHGSDFMADDWIAGLALVRDSQHNPERNGAFEVSKLINDDEFSYPTLGHLSACSLDLTVVHMKVLGYSDHDFTSEQIESMSRKNNVSQIALDVLTNNTLACVKLSALFFYRRIFCASGKRTMFGTTTWVTIVVVILWLIVFQFLTGFQCGTHFSALWDGSYIQYCTISFPFLYGLVISDFLLDIWILALPIPSILRLNTTLQRKWSRRINCSNGSVHKNRIGRSKLSPLYRPRADPVLITGLVTESFFYTMLEAGIALIAVNLPSLRVFSVSAKTGEILRSVRSLMEMPFLRNSTTNIERNISEVPSISSMNEYGKVKSYNTHPSENPHVLRKDLP